LVFYPLLWDRP